MPNLYSRYAIQLNVEDNADRIVEIVVSLERLGGLKQQAVVAVLSEQPFEAPENARIIVNHENESSIRQDQSSVRSSSIRQQHEFVNRHVCKLHVSKMNNILCIASCYARTLQRHRLNMFRATVLLLSFGTMAPKIW
jgi:hypothetical protein